MIAVNEYAGTEWRMGIRKEKTDGPVTLADDKTYKSRRTAQNAAIMKNTHWPRYGWEFVAVKVELRMTEIVA